MKEFQLERRNPLCKEDQKTFRIIFCFLRKHMTDFSANRKKNDLGVLQLNLDMSE